MMVGKYYFGLANDMYLYLLDDKFFLDKNKQPTGSDNSFPMKHLKIIEGRVNCDYDFKVNPTREPVAKNSVYTLKIID